MADDERRFPIEASYVTRAKRLPEYLGRIGVNYLPVVVTGPQFYATLGTTLLMLIAAFLPGIGFWRWMPFPLNAALLLGVIGAVAVYVRYGRLDGRTPLGALIGVFEWFTRSRAGHIHGRNLRLKRVRYGGVAWVAERKDPDA